MPLESTGVVAAALAAVEAKTTESISKRGADRLLEIISKGLTKIGGDLYNTTIVGLRIGFEGYLSGSYEKCKFFKTIINANQPLEVRRYYVNCTMTLNKSQFSDVAVIEKIDNLRSVIVTGLAGSGKSMFMKFLTIMKFETLGDEIPLFVELRHLNSFSERNILTYMRISCGGYDARLSQEQFNLSLKSGAVILILDGFDELNYEIRDEIERQIIQIRHDFPKLKIVLSSRPDERFGAWLAFSVFQVDKLNRAQVIALIDSIDYDRDIKSRFKRAINDHLYNSHESFLSSPLLATIMMLTYENFAEIPVKMHAFYREAFDTLLQKHDAQKGQFLRKTYTGIAKDEFKFCLAAFCAMSYLNEVFSFSENNLIATAKTAIEYSKKMGGLNHETLTPENFIADLMQSVCILQKDGIETSFVHRSFQEYFSALFVTNLHGSEVRSLLDKFAMRFIDSVVLMANDMDRETVEKEWIIPTINYILQSIKNDKIQQGSVARSIKIYRRISFEKIDKKVFCFVQAAPSSLYPSIITIGRIYRPPFDGYIQDADDWWPMLFHKSFALKDFVDLFVNKSALHARVEDFREVSATQRRRKILHLSIQSGDDWWIDLIGLTAYLDQLENRFREVKKAINDNTRGGKKIFRDFTGLI